ncbi:dihydroorotase [Oscillatoriales cyanobacterium USR001]|nr:dihydroorotase [Oscillatoriales cyanobacterium USR001]
MNCELMQKVRVLDPLSGTDTIADVLIEDGNIKAVEENISELPINAQVLNCKGLVLGPGLIDIYSHSGEPGFEERETLKSLIESAVAGGFTRLAILPTTAPPLDNPGNLSRLKSKVLNVKAKIEFWGALTLAIEGQQMAELADLADSGVVGFTDSLPLSNLALVRYLLEYIKPLNLPVAFWPCDRFLVGNGVAREGVQSITLGLPGNPAIAETSALAALLELVEATGTPTHIMRVSCARSVALIQAAKKRGLPVTASTTWMHLLLNTDAIAGGVNNLSCPYDPSLRLEPPLGNPNDRLALIKGVKERVIDAIAIDHRPYTYEEKTVAFADAPPGAIGLELALPLLWQNLVTTGELTALELWRVLSTGPSICLRQKPMAVTPGISAELTLFNPLENWQVEAKTLKSLSVNTPWLNQQITGRVVKTWIS